MSLSKPSRVIVVEPVQAATTAPAEPPPPQDAPAPAPAPPQPTSVKP